MTHAKVKPHVEKSAVTIVGVITLGAFVSLFNQTVMAPALPALMREFAVTAGTAQWVTTIYMLISGIMVPISGYFMDKYPTRKLFFLSMGLFAAGTVLCAVCPSYGFLIAGRVAQAAGAGILMPLVGTVPLLVFPVELRGTAMGVAGIVMAAGPAVGPVLGGLVIDSWGWRPMFLIIAALAFAIMLLGIPLMKNVGTLKDPKLDIPSVVLSTIAFGGLLFGFSSASDAGWTSPMVIAPAVVGVIALVLFVRRQLTLEVPMLELKCLKTRNFLIAALMVTLINAAVAATNVILPLLVQNGMGASATTTGMVMLPASIAGIVLSPISGMLFDRMGPRLVTVGGMAIIVGSLFGFGALGTGLSVGLAATLCALQACGQGLANMPVNTWGVNALPDELIAHGNAIANTGRQVFGAISTALLVTVMSSVQASALAAGASTAEATVAGAGAAYFGCAAVALAGFVVAVLFVFENRRGTAAPAKVAKVK
ncbi:MAG: MDR family MFS transporter [Coriobacteriaceae bacterium]|nr:MDR family MFS transporter [Coriobacteriaceae bacterium]